ncbi:MAG: hypothetical protein ABI583_09180 [Betaproteobacteria bacterium]
MNNVQKSLTGISLIAFIVGGAMFYRSSLTPSRNGTQVLESRNDSKSRVGVSTTSTSDNASARGINNDSNSSIVKNNADAAIYKAFPDLMALDGRQRSRFLEKAIADKIAAYFAKYPNATEAMGDLVRLARAGDAGAAVTAAKIADRCAQTEYAAAHGQVAPFGIPMVQCNAMSKADLNAVPSLLIAAARAGDPLAAFAIMNYSNYQASDVYIKTFLHDPNLLASFQEETLKAQRYYEPVGNEATLDNIAVTYRNGTVLPQDPVLEVAYLMAAYAVATTHLPPDMTDSRLTMPFGINDLTGKLTPDQRNATTYNAQAILNRCCNGIPLPTVLSQRKG